MERASGKNNGRTAGQGNRTGAATIGKPSRQPFPFGPPTPPKAAVTWPRTAARAVPGLPKGAKYERKKDRA